MSQSWATEQELTFVKNLGTYREGHEIIPMRLKLLENYVKAARERYNWGNVNGERVIQFAEAELVEERLKTEQTSLTSLTG
jgi:hypothetical protein